MSSPIDPVLLLNVLEPILDLRTGGVRDVQVASRFVNVMRNARKLVQRCIYLNIFKATPCEETRQRILTLGGWQILYDWLKEAERLRYWSFIFDILQLFITLPVCVDLLLSNGAAKLIRRLSKRQDIDQTLRNLSIDIVSIWKDIIVGEHKSKKEEDLADMTSTIDPNIDLESSEDSFNGNGEKAHFYTALQDGRSSAQNSNNFLKVAGGKMHAEDQMKIENFQGEKFDASSSNAHGKRPKTVKTYRTTFRSTGLDQEMDSNSAPAKKRKMEEAAAILKRKGGSDHTTEARAGRPADKPAQSKQDQKHKVAQPKIVPAPVGQTMRTSSADVATEQHGNISSPAAMSPPANQLSQVKAPAVSNAKTTPPPAKTTQMIESDIFMAALTSSSGSAQPRSQGVIRRKKITPPNVTSGGSSESAAASASTTTTVRMANVQPETSKSALPKPQFYKEIIRSTASESTVPSNGPNAINYPQSQPDSAMTSSEGPVRKKRVQWVKDADLVQVRFFEIEEGERVNVNKTASKSDLASLDKRLEREAMEAAKRSNPLSGPRTEAETYFTWRLTPCENIAELSVRGCNSEEKRTQLERTKNILAEIYFTYDMIPDSPREPDFLASSNGAQQESAPIIIPLEDAVPTDQNAPVIQEGGSTPNATLPPALAQLLQNLNKSGMMPPPSNAQQLAVPPPNSVVPYQSSLNPAFAPPSSFDMPPPMQRPPMGGPGWQNVPPPNYNPSAMPPNRAGWTGPLPPRPGPGGPFPAQPVYAGGQLAPRGNMMRPGGPGFRPNFRSPYHGQGGPRSSRFGNPLYDKVCPFFLQNRCTFGDNCRYKHVRPDAPPVASSEIAQTAASSAAPLQPPGTQDYPSRYQVSDNVMGDVDYRQNGSNALFAATLDFGDQSRGDRDYRLPMAMVSPTYSSTVTTTSSNLPDDILEGSPTKEEDEIPDTPASP